MPRSLGRTASYHETKREAEAWLVALLAKEQERDRLPGADELLGAYLQRWYQRMALVFGPGRLDSARQMLATAQPLAAVRLMDLRYNHVADWATGLVSGGLAPGTVALRKQLLAQALGDLVPDVLVANPAARSVRLPRPAPTGDPVHLEELEAQRLLRTTQGTPGYPLWRLLLGTGIRIAEALGLTWERIDLAHGTAEIAGQYSKRAGGMTTTKTGQSRTVTLTNRVLAALLATPDRTGFVFRGRASTGRPLGYSTAQEWFAAAIAAAGLPEVTIHALRHTFASVALSRGVPVTDVAQALGHSSPSTTTRTYAHALRQRQGAAELALAEALDGVF